MEIKFISNVSLHKRLEDIQISVKYTGKCSSLKTIYLVLLPLNHFARFETSISS